jgi:hypothetical protein
MYMMRQNAARKDHKRDFRFYYKYLEKSSKLQKKILKSLIHACVTKVDVILALRIAF